MTAKIKLNAASGGGSVSLKAPSTTTGNASIELQLPVADGSASQSIITDASGNLSFAAPKLPHAFVFMDSQYFTTSATKMGFNNSTTNDSSFNVTIDRTNKRLTPTSAGIYLVQTQLMFSYSTGGSNIQFVNFIYKNGSEFAYNTQDQYRGSGLVSNCMCQCIVSCNGTGDYFEMYAKHNGGGNAIQGSNSTFMVMRIA
tara:strand:+ start:894 stop:1490 length:597 start_codon:yes stop_codon:yes gene_type:complete